MKSSDLLIIGGAGAAAYLLTKKANAEAAALSNAEAMATYLQQLGLYSAELSFGDFAATPPIPPTPTSGNIDFIGVIEKTIGGFVNWETGGLL